MMLDFPSLQANLGNFSLNQPSLWTPHLHHIALFKHIPNVYSTYYKGNKVPSGSLAMVGYTMGDYEKDGELVATPNLNWVIVIAADD